MFTLKRSQTVCKNLTTLMYRKFSKHQKTCQKNVLPFESRFPSRRVHDDFSFEDKILRSVFPQVKETILNEGLREKPEFNTRFAKLIDYCVYLDRQFLGSSLLFLRAHKYLEKPSLELEDKLTKAAMVAWSFKLSEASQIVMDDIIDKALIRYNKPTWYKVVGENEAMLDASFLQAGAQFLLINFLSDHPQYLNIEKECLKSHCVVQISQIVFTRSYELHELKKNADFGKAYGVTVYLLSTALYFANIVDPKLHSAVREFSIKLAEYIVNQDDARSITTSAEKMGKDCTDILYLKPSWLMIEAFKRSNSAQRKILEDMPNKQTRQAAEEVKNIFKELNLKAVFKEYEEKFYESMLLEIEKLPKELPNQLFLDLLHFSVADKLAS